MPRVCVAVDPNNGWPVPPQLTRCRPAQWPWGGGAGPISGATQRNFSRTAVPKPRGGLLPFLRRNRAAGRHALSQPIQRPAKLRPGFAVPKLTFRQRPTPRLKPASNACADSMPMFTSITTRQSRRRGRGGAPPPAQPARDNCPSLSPRVLSTSQRPRPPARRARESLRTRRSGWRTRMSLMPAQRIHLGFAEACRAGDWAESRRHRSSASGDLAPELFDALVVRRPVF